MEPVSREPCQIPPYLGARIQRVHAQVHADDAGALQFPKQPRYQLASEAATLHARQQVDVQVRRVAALVDAGRHAAVLLGRVVADAVHVLRGRPHGARVQRRVGALRADARRPLGFKAHKEGGRVGRGERVPAHVARGGVGGDQAEFGRQVQVGSDIDAAERVGVVRVQVRAVVARVARLCRKSALENHRQLNMPAVKKNWN